VSVHRTGPLHLGDSTLHGQPIKCGHSHLELVAQAGQTQNQGCGFPAAMLSCSEADIRDHVTDNGIGMKGTLKTQCRGSPSNTEQQTEMMTPPPAAPTSTSSSQGHVQPAQQQQSEANTQTDHELARRMAYAEATAGLVQDIAERSELLHYHREGCHHAQARCLLPRPAGQCFQSIDGHTAWRLIAQDSCLLPCTADKCSEYPTDTLACYDVTSARCLLPSLAGQCSQCLGEPTTPENTQCSENPTDYIAPARRQLPCVAVLHLQSRCGAGNTTWRELESTHCLLPSAAQWCLQDLVDPLACRANALARRLLTLLADQCFSIAQPLEIIDQLARGDDTLPHTIAAPSMTDLKRGDCLFTAAPACCLPCSGGQGASATVICSVDSATLHDIGGPGPCLTTDRNETKHAHDMLALGGLGSHLATSVCQPPADGHTDRHIAAELTFTTPQVQCEMYSTLSMIRSDKEMICHRTAFCCPTSLVCPPHCQCSTSHYTGSSSSQPLYQLATAHASDSDPPGGYGVPSQHTPSTCLEPASVVVSSSA